MWIFNKICMLFFYWSLSAEFSDPAKEPKSAKENFLPVQWHYALIKNVYRKNNF